METVKPVLRWAAAEGQWMRRDGAKKHAERWIKRFRAGQHARGYVQTAVAIGLLPNLKEVEIACADGCGKRAVCYDHRDYGKPLDVEPVCRGCNIRRGPARDVERLWIKALPKQR